MEEFKNAYVQYLVDMANLRKNEDEMIKSRKENRKSCFRAGTQQQNCNVFTPC